MEKLQQNRGMVCAAFSEARELENTYAELVRAGLSPTDVSVLVTEEAHAEAMRDRGVPGVLDRLAPMQGGFTGGIRMRALGPARSFGVSGSVATGLIRTGIDDAEAAWLMNALAEGQALILVHANDASAADVAEQVVAENNAQRYTPPAEAGRENHRGKTAFTASASAARRLDRYPSRPG